MKTILSLFVLFSMAFGLQQAQAQSGRSYEEWRAAAKAKKTTAKNSKPANTKASKNSNAPKAAMAAPAGKFMGTFPCADCQGINTELMLNGGANGASRSFTMKQTYLGKPAGNNIVTTSGKWFLAKGNKQDPNAVVLQLIPTEGEVELLYFLQVSDSEIKLLDRKQAEIQSQHNYSLKRR